MVLFIVGEFFGHTDYPGQVSDGYETAGADDPKDHTGPGSRRQVYIEAETSDGCGGVLEDSDSSGFFYFLFSGHKLAG
jgi:hypothetical protein